MKFAVVGHGFMGSRHVAMLNSFEELECAAVCDTDPGRLDGLDAKIKRYHDIDSLLADKTLNGVIIATPNKAHKEQVIKAAHAGKHIICEKPAAMSVADFDEMLRAANANKVVLTAHQQRRFDADFQTIKTAYDRKLLGEVYLIKSMLYGYNGNMHDWHIHVSEGGGMLLDWGVHLIDQILYLAGCPLKSLYADIRSVINVEVDDFYKIIMRFENNITAEIELGTYMLSDKPGWFPRHWYMCGNKGSMYVDKFEPEGKIVRTAKLLTDVRNQAGRYTGPTRSFGEPEEGLLLTEGLPHVSTAARDYFVNFINAMQGKEELLVKPEEIRTVLTVMEAVRESGRTMQSIPF
ncbi:MAG: Gfo/Idh/MocA family oxidoreductase [Spirochaetaceae bacterium]|jgi:predicted dehydrogenase|nr:Gfo/Idh/MocA family oxidoreductase [Spirochaetaceae bacterium]